MADRRALAAIMFTDIQGYTKLMGEDERGAMEFLRAHNAIFGECATHFSGEIIKSIGDSYLICFGSAVDAVQCAWEAQQRLKTYNKGHQSARKLLVRVSIHLGDIVLRDGDVFGDGVNLASRLQGVTRPGGITLSRDLFAQVKGKLPFAMRSMGLVELNGVQEPVEVFELPTGLEDGAAPVALDGFVGRQVGPCQLEQVIGKGGMGTVYRGRHVTLNRIMAVKILSGDALSEPAAERLLAEARAAAAIDDPRVVQIFDAGRQGALRYVVMQLIEGETLEALVARKGPLQPEEARRVMREVLRGLSAAHKKGLVHRDVKPANIMLDAAGNVKILDFGLAAPIGRESGATPQGAPTGSFDFMSPEQGFDAAPDPRQDLYALGSTWFYALAGLPPFSAGDAATMLLMHRESPVPDVRAANREVTTQAAELLKRLMDKDPARRPATAEEVLAELDQPGMVVELAAEKSPFRLLPPPPEPQPEGLAADPVVQAALRAAEEAPAAAHELPGLRPSPAPRPQAAPAPAAVIAALPPPPPALPDGHRMELSAKFLLAALFVLLFGRHWLSAGREDLLGLGLAGGGCAALLALADGPPALRRAGGAVFYLSAAAALWLLGAPAGGLPGIEWLVGEGVGVVLGAAGLVLGYWTSGRDRPTGAALLLCSVAVLAAVCAGMGLPAGAPWATALPQRLGELWAALRASGGLHRWAGVAAAAACAVISRTSC